MTLLLYLSVGLCIGGIGGMIGIGGGVLLIPALTQLFNIEPRKAAGISLAVLALPVTLPGAWKYYQHGYLTRADLQTALVLALAFGFGTYVGAQVQHVLDVHVLRILFGLLLLYVGMRTLMYASPEAVHAVAGLGALVIGWVAYVALRALGRKHLKRPDLGELIRNHAEKRPKPDEYYI